MFFSARINSNKSCHPLSSAATSDDSYAPIENGRGFKTFSFLKLLITRRPPKFFKGKPITAVDFTRHDSKGCAEDLIAWEESGVVFNGLENLEPTVSVAYKQLKADKSLLNDNQRSGSSSSFN